MVPSASTRRAVALGSVQPESDNVGFIKRLDSRIGGACQGDLSGMQTALVYIAAAFAEIAGCFAFWAVFRLGKPVFWLVPGVLSLVAFAYLLTLVEAAFAGRIYAAYGGV